MKRIMSILQYYANVVVMCFGTAWFGWQLLQSNQNVIDRVDIFPPHLDAWIGWAMMVLSALKVILLFHPNRKLKKYAMIGLTILWVLVTWSYWQNIIPNTGYIMSGTLTLLCYVELWRGDYSG